MNEMGAVFQQPCTFSSSYHACQAKHLSRSTPGIVHVHCLRDVMWQTFNNVKFQDHAILNVCLKWHSITSAEYHIINWHSTYWRMHQEILTAIGKRDLSITPKVLRSISSTYTIDTYTFRWNQTTMHHQQERMFVWRLNILIAFKCRWDKPQSTNVALLCLVHRVVELDHGSTRYVISSVMESLWVLPLCSRVAAEENVARKLSNQLYECCWLS